LAAAAIPITEDDPDNLLVDQAQAGDTRAFEQLYRRHYKRVYALCLRMTANRESAEECTQEAFINTWRKLDSFKKQSRFTTWLHTLSSRVTLDHLRKNKSWIKLVLNIDETPEVEERSQAGPEAELSDMDKLLMRLPERARLVFTLHGIEGYRHVEIAEMMNISASSSRSQYHRARQLLQEWLNEDQ